MNSVAIGKIACEMKLDNLFHKNISGFLNYIIVLLGFNIIFVSKYFFVHNSEVTIALSLIWSVFGFTRSFVVSSKILLFENSIKIKNYINA